jgi:cytochrome c-type biogenesis protein CcmE
VSKGAQITVGATAIALLLGWYGYTNLESDATYRYYQTLAEFQATPISALPESLRVHGYVSKGSIDRNVDAKHVRFLVQNEAPHAGGETGTLLPVVFTSLETPDLFQDGAEVVIEGRMEERAGDRVFLADNVLAKCPSKFEAEAPGLAMEAEL